MNNNKRNIKNIPDTRTYQVNKTSTKKLKTMSKRVGTIAATAGIAIGVMSQPLISTIVNNVKQANSTKDAIRAATIIEEIAPQIAEQDPLKEAELNTLQNYINRYIELKNNKSRTVAEEQEYMQVCIDILNMNSNVAVELRTDLLRNEIAQAIGITDPQEIAKIKIECVWYSEGANGTSASPKIILPDGTVFTSKNMDSKLKAEIEATRWQLTRSVTPELLKLKDLEKAVDKMMQYIYGSSEYSENNNIEVKEGNFKTIEDDEGI